MSLLQVLQMIGHDSPQNRMMTAISANHQTCAGSIMEKNIRQRKQIRPAQNHPKEIPHLEIQVNSHPQTFMLKFRFSELKYYEAMQNTKIILKLRT